MDLPPVTRASLIVKLRDPGDETAWSEFVALYEPLVYRLVRKKGLQDADAHDLCQEVFKAVAQAVDRWEPGRGSFRGWLSRITRNLLINFLTRGRYQPRGSGATSVMEWLDAQPAPDPSASASASALFEAEYHRRIFQSAAELVRKEFNPATWQAFWQTAVENRPPSQVALELGLSTGAVYIARSRVLARLRRKVQEFADDPVAIEAAVENGHVNTLAIASEVDDANSIKPV
jgi:RNA polymerase sigma-70 factor (ECF subfamily)